VFALIKTFGCKVNFVDGEEIASRLASKGWECAHSEDSHSERAAVAPDLVIVNTCAVTHTAVAKARQFIHRMLRRYPSTRIVVTGCCARNDEIAAELKGLGVEVSSSFDYANISPQPAIVSQRKTRCRRFIKVQDGCDCYCAYCIVPYVRRSWNVEIGDVLGRVAHAADDGVAEIVMCGVNLGLYSEPRAGFELVQLIARVLEKLPAGMRLRLSSVEPEHVTSGLLKLFANDSLCPHLHLPLQSGSARVLSEMGRRCSFAAFAEAVQSFREIGPYGSVTTDLMVGFPTETEDDFSLTCEAVNRFGFERAHVFRYSRRPGTAAAELKPIQPSVVSRREKELISLCANVADARWQRFVGRECTIAVEKSGEGYGEAYQRVKLPPGLMEGNCGLVKAVLTSYSIGAFIGVPPT
jgi:threonylcarbamoyladenosine tRNA methylthiotransferase MtaB